MPSMKNIRGYTLVELLVSISIFSIIMLAATAAYFSFISYNRQAQTSATVVNSLFFTIDAISRELRTGRDYTCTGSCSLSGVNEITFTDPSNCVIKYKLNTGTHTIERSLDNSANPCSSTFTSSANEPITDPLITVDSLLFYVRGQSSSDTIQPMVTIVINGYACVPNTDCTGTGTGRIPFQIETGATQRTPDL
jgi:prepilin-type N-terminal cleavage/methylation domain-containing protein